MKRLLASALLATVSWPLAAQADDVTLTFWHSFSGGTGLEVIDTLVDRFEAANPGVSIEHSSVGNYNDMITRLQAAVAGNRLPDLVMLEITRYGIFADRGVLEPLDPYLDAAPEIRADIRPFALEAALYQGESYVLPFNTSTPVMYYNKDLFAAAGLDPEAPPATWDALLETAQALTIKEGDETVQWGVNGPAQWVRWAFTEQNGGGWMDPVTHDVEIDLPASIEAYQFAADLVNEHGVASRDAAIDERVGKEFFNTGIAAITFDSTGGLGGLLRNVEFDLGVAPLPCNVECAAPIGGASLGIIASAPQENKDAAWAFLSHVMTADSNVVMFTETGYMPILFSTEKHPDAVARMEEVPAYTVAINQLDVAFARARPPAMPAIRSMEPSVWESIVLQQETATEALTDFAEEMKEMVGNL